MKLQFCALSVLLVLVRMPFGCESLVGTLDLEQGGVFSDAEDGVVVFDGLFGSHWEYLLFLIMNWLAIFRIYIVKTILDILDLSYATSYNMLLSYFFGDQNSRKHCSTRLLLRVNFT